MKSSASIFNHFARGILVLSLLTGCTLGPDFEDPVVEIPQTYRTPALLTEDTEDLKWWELFDDPLLVTMVKTALEHNRDVKVAISRIAQSRAALGFTEADGLPRLDINAGVNTGDFTGTGKSADTITNAYIVAPLSWEIDFWGKFSRANAAPKPMLNAMALMFIQLASSLMALYMAVINPTSG